MEELSTFETILYIVVSMTVLVITIQGPEFLYRKYKQFKNKKDEQS